MSTLLHRAIPYVAAFAVISAVCLLVHLEIQQSLRQSANDPQIEMAEDAAATAANGGEVPLRPRKIEISQSIAPYLIVLDSVGKVIATDAMLDGNTPTLPTGIFDWVRKNGEDRVSWQPRRGVRSALVIVPVNGGAGGFVAAGRSLREVERREAYSFQAAASVWVALILAAFVSIFFYRFASHRTTFADSNQLTTSVRIPPNR